MATLIRGNSGVDADVDEDRNVKIFQTIPGYPTAGGFYNVAGKSGAAAIAAALATDIPLMTMRHAAASVRRAYVTKVRVLMTTITVGALGGVPSVLGLQRFNGATPTGGIARTAARRAETKGTISDVTDIRDNNATLTVGGVVFGTELAWALTPTDGTATSKIEMIYEPSAPVELAAGDGLALRTRQAGPLTATWFFTYTFDWFER